MLAGMTLVAAVVVAVTVGGGTAATSASPPVNTAQPSITGTTREGEVLSANPGAWKNAPSSYSYQWERCDSKGNNCTSIVGATARRYTVGVADVAHTLRVRVTASNSRGSHSATSAQSALVAPSKSGGAAISVSTIALPDRLIVDRVSFSPSPLQSRAAFTAR